MQTVARPIVYVGTVVSGTGPAYGFDFFFQAEAGIRDCSLKRFKDDVREVREGFEFGIAVKGFGAAKKGDIIETFIIEKIARRLEG